MTAGHEGARGAGGGEYGGLDALMAAITGDPLPEEARRDAAFLAEHRSAQADVAVLRGQLARMAEVLTGETGEPEGTAEIREIRETGETKGTAGIRETSEAKGTAETEAGETGEAGRTAASGETGEADEAREAGEARKAGRTGESGGSGEKREPVDAPGSGSAGSAGTAVPGAATPPSPPARRPRSRTRPAGANRPPRPGGPPRALRVALGTLAGAAAFSLALGFGWLVSLNGMGGADTDSGAASAKSAGDAGREVAGDPGRPAEPERELACSRLLVEGTVAKVERQRGSSRSRVTLTVIRSYKPARGPAEAGFLLDAGAAPAPREGQHVLVGVRQGRQSASLWAVGDSRVAANRAWITDALPGSRHLTCPSGG